jgi:tRNA threonylcarbamoyladenosine biosynthesis protein TsaE
MTQTQPDITVYLPDALATDRLGQWFADHLTAGDCLLLSGSIGAGKSQLCRALIRARLGRAEDVPSPTFTLVQTYLADVEIWHADLYRLSHPDEVMELGLEDAFSSAICLIEWPDRLGRFAPKNAISVTLSAQGEGRMAQIRGGARPALMAGLAQDWAHDD